MQTTKHPYELLIRWDQNGALAGAHVQYRYVINRDDGERIGETLGKAEPLALGDFPLTDVLSQAQADALAQVMAVAVERDALMARVAELEARLSKQGASPL